MKLTLGEMLKRFRMEKNVKSKPVYNGICSGGMFSHVEKNIRVADILQFICFMERMGVSPEQCSVMVTEEEYVYLEWRNQVLDAIEKRDWTELNGLLQADVANQTHCNEKLEQQFWAYAKGIYEVNQGNYGQATALFKKAWEETVPSLEEVEKGKVLLSYLEFSYLLLYLYYGVKGEILSQTEGEELFKILERYVDSGILDSIQQAKIYPKLVCVGILCLDIFSQEEKRLYLEKSIEMARDDKTFHDITEVLRLYIEILERENSEELAFYRTHYRVFCDLLESEGYDIGFSPEMTAISRPKYYAIEEYLESERKAKRLTQTDVCEGICEPETYSRIENGKQNPSRNNLMEFSERLGIRWSYYRGELDTCNPKAYRLRVQHRLAKVEGKYEESLNLLGELETLLDMSIIENLQYIEFNKILLKYRLKQIELQEFCEKLMEILEVTSIKEKCDEGQMYYTQTELEIIGEIGQGLKNLGKYKEGLQFILPVVKEFKNSKLGFEYQANGFRFLLANLGVLYFRIGEYDRCINVEKYVKYQYIKYRKGSGLVAIIDAMAGALEQKGTEYVEEYKRMYRDTYYISDFYNMKVAKKVAQNYYEDNFEPDMKWYK